jgi:hypothetical protein
MRINHNISAMITQSARNRNIGKTVESTKFTKNQTLVQS